MKINNGLLTIVLALATRFDHRPDLIVRNRIYYRLRVLAGVVSLAMTICHSWKKIHKMVNVRSGQTVYFQYMMSWGLIFEEAEDQERAAITASRLVPLN
jgi:hypothetical protein